MKQDGPECFHLSHDPPLSSDCVPNNFQLFILRFDPETGGFANTMAKRWPQPRWRYEKRDLGKTIAGLVRKYQMNQANMMAPISL